MTLNRRQFLGLAGSAAGTAATGGLLWKVGTSGDAGVATDSTTPTAVPPSTTVPETLTPPTTATPTEPTPPDPDQDSASKKVVILVQMAGGNDGLNTLVPSDGAYRDARPTIAISESDLVALDGITQFGLHPALAPLGDMWSRQQLAIVQGLAIPNQSRSHFVALDSWWAGSAELASSGGWLGRWLDATAPDTPNPMRAIALGGGAPALAGQNSQPVIVRSLDGFALTPPRGSSGVAEAFASMAAPREQGAFGDAQAAIPVAVESVATLQSIFEAMPPFDLEYEIESLFHAAASIVEADVGTELILINVPGFDTHSDQLARHVELLGGVANGVSAMYEHLESTGNAGRTATVAYSEFGRRVHENGSGGTDHGSAGLAFVAGPSVTGRQLVGDLDLVNLDRGDIAPTIDARSVYADILDWLGGPTASVLGGTFDSYSLL